MVLYGLLAGMRAPGLLFGMGYALTTVPALIQGCSVLAMSGL